MSLWALFGLVVLVAVLVAVDGVVIALAARASPAATWERLAAGAGGGLGLGGLVGYAFGRSEARGLHRD